MVSKRSKLIHAVVKIVLSRLAPKFKNQVSYFFFFFFMWLRICHLIFLTFSIKVEYFQFGLILKKSQTKSVICYRDSRDSDLIRFFFMLEPKWKYLPIFSHLYYANLIFPLYFRFYMTAKLSGPVIRSSKRVTNEMLANLILLCHD